ncbi:MMPL family transporter [Catenuloplanes atrovinosus]|uniref:RND superfamily putative drug exporter n=1 Tax=Catenuloplanes atrovinosus TaxID=137266 RepID=A0AAE3YNZ9_9ACTN|nr:MMPL family transporter [Catenuloplanes atrovinosus]MDR7275241.1 RND superfamily putative drug exporter [Catenuloplanes atrovinosus]
MARFLYRLGAVAARRRLIFLGVSLAVITAALGAMFVFAGSFAPGHAIPGSPGQLALEKVRQHFPQEGGVEGDMVFVAPSGARITDEAVAAQVRAAAQRVREVEHIAEVGDPLEQVSADGRVAVVSLAFDVPSGTEVEPAQQETVRAAGAAYGERFGAHGGRVLFGGDAFEEELEPFGTPEIIGLGVALLVLLVTFGSMLAAGIPMLTAALGVGGTAAGTLLAANLFDVSQNALTLALMLGLAVGIDYALLIVSRHRDQLTRGMGIPDSIALATATAGSSVFFAGLTVIIALVGLTLAGVPMLTSMGLAAAGAVAIAVVLALTMLPAILSLAGEGLRPKPGSRAARRILRTRSGGAAAAWVGLVIRHPWKMLVAVVLGLAVLAVPAAQLQLALNDNGSAARDSEPRQAYDLIADAFGPGVNGKLAVLVEGDSVAATAEAVVDTVTPMAGVVEVNGPLIAEDGRAAVVQIVPATGPRDGATSALVEDLRAALAPIGTGAGDYVEVTGLTVVSLDAVKQLNGALLPFTVVVVGLSLLLLLIAFRSWTVPLKATAGFLLSVGAAFGAMVAVFQWGWAAGPLGVPLVGPVPSFAPIIVMAVLFGLAMDYEVFLVSAMREHYARHRDATEAIRAGGRDSGRVVVAAAVIMIIVFASFLFSHDPNVMPIALALAFGVLVDAFVVRLTLVPAVLKLLGDRAWTLPRWLDRIVPDVDVEGHHLTGEKPPATTAREPELVG